MIRPSVGLCAIASLMIAAGALGWVWSAPLLRETTTPTWLSSPAWLRLFVELVLPRIGFSSLLLIAGIGIFWRKRWARALSLWQAALALVYAGFTFVWLMTAGMGAHVVQKWTERDFNDEAFQIGGLVLFGLLALIVWNLSIIWFFNRPGVKAQFVKGDYSKA